MNIDTVSAQLKYFFLIDIDQIIQNITSELPKKIPPETSDYNSIFTPIFNNILNSTKLYSSMLSSDIMIHKSFFSRSYQNPSLLSLLKNVIKNNLILHSCFATINADGFLIDVTAKTTNTLSSGFDIANEEELKVTYVRGETNSQQFGRRKKKTQKTTLPKKVIEFLFEECTWSTIKTRNQFASLCNFLITNNKDQVSKFDRAYHSDPHRNLYGIYQKLYTDYHKQQLNLKPYKLSRLFFCLQMNTIYGLDSAFYITKYLNCIRDMSNSETKFTLKKLEGQQLIDIMKQLYDMPLYYNKHIFLEYAFQAIENSPDLLSQYLERSPDVAARTLDIGSVTTSQKTERAIKLLKNFFYILNNITLPILVSLWSIIIDQLIKEEIISAHDIQAYALTLFNTDKSTEKDKYYSKYDEKIFFTDNIPLECIAPSVDDITYIPTKSKKDISELLKYTYKLDPIERLQLFYAAPSSMYSPLDRIIKPLQESNLSLSTKSDKKSHLLYLYNFLHNLNELNTL